MTNLIALLRAGFLGIGSGLILACLLGPVFFALIQLSINKGFRTGFTMALGIASSDIICAIAAWFLAGWLSTIPALKVVLSVLGGGMLIAMGLASILSKLKTVKPNSANALNGNHYFVAAQKGFLLNIINPGTLFFWLGTIGTLRTQNAFTGIQQLAFITMLLTTVLSTDTLKVYLAGKLQAYATPKRLMWLNKTVGTILVVFGLYLLYQASSVLLTAK